jgi:hypothetical protein
MIRTSIFLTFALLSVFWVGVIFSPAASGPPAAFQPGRGAGQADPAPPRTAISAQASQDFFADFDFADGTVFPASAEVRIGNVNVPPGASEAHVPVMLDRPTPNTVAARVMTRNGSGIEGRQFEKIDTWVFFRPGDPLVRTVRIPLRNLGEGRHFELIFPSGVVGGKEARGVGKITALAGAARPVAQNQRFRTPRRFSPTGSLVYDLDPSRVRWTDGGSATTWSTRLPHGRTQPANAETGLYLDPAQHRSPLPPMEVQNGVVVLRSQQLSRGLRYEGDVWWHGAAVLTGEKLRATHIRYGQYEWEAMMPNRRGAWPALWLLPVSGWPPEIDVYEGFGDSRDFDFTRHISSNLHGGRGGKRSFVVPMRLDAQSAYGLTGFDRSYHRFAVDIAPDLITWFVDDQEVFQAVNPFRGTTWFPLMTLAVKHKGDYTGGSGEMRLRSFRVWAAPEN